MDAQESPTTTLQLPAEKRKAILDREVAAAVAAGGRRAWWGGGSFEAVVSSHRYLSQRYWGYVLLLLLLVPFVIGPSVRNLVGGLRPVLDALIIVVWFGAMALLAGRTRYQRITIDEHGASAATGTSFVGLAAALTLIAGLTGSIPGAAHLQGVVSAASSRGYDYDARLAGLLILGIGMVFAGVVCLTAVRGLAHGERPAWDRALIGSLLLVLVTLPTTPIGGQGELAAVVSLPAWLDLFVLAGARQQLERG